MAETATQEKTLRVKMNAEWHPHKHRCIQVRTEGQMPARLIVQVPECGCRLRVTPGSAPRQRLTVNLSKISRKQGCVRCLGMELRDPDLEDAERDDVEERRSQLRDAGYQRHDIAVVLNRCYHDSLAPEEAWVKPGVAGVYFLCCLCSAEETRADPDAAAAPIGHDPADGPATPSFTSLSAYERHVVTHSVWWTTPLHCLAPPAVGADGRCIDAATARELLRTDAPTNNLHAAAGPLCPTPLSFARQLCAAGEAPPGSAAALVLSAAEPWSPRTHALFPSCVRGRALFLLLVGHRLAMRENGKIGSALIDVWIAHVMSLAVSRA